MTKQKNNRRGTFSYVDVGNAFLGMRGSVIVTPTD
jgi:hypothetical protein